MKPTNEILEDAAATFLERNQVYGDNYLNMGRVFKGMFPDGVRLHTEDDFIRFHILLLAVVKQTRYANNWAAGGHPDSSLDSSVYWAMLHSIDTLEAGELQAMGYADHEPNEREPNINTKLSQSTMDQLDHLKSLAPDSHLTAMMIVGKYRDLHRTIVEEVEDDDIPY